LTTREARALPQLLSAATGVIFSGQNFCRAQSQNHMYKSDINAVYEDYGVEPKWNNETASFQVGGETKALGYKRRYSSIRNIDSFVIALNDLP
jgi:hypothetical protein